MTTGVNVPLPYLNSCKNQLLGYLPWRQIFYLLSFIFHLSIIEWITSKSMLFYFFIIPLFKILIQFQLKKKIH